MSPDEVAFNKEFEIRVDNLIEHLDKATDEIWKIRYSNLGSDHRLREVVKITLFMDLQNKVIKSLDNKGIS